MRARPVWCFSVSGMARPDRDRITRWLTGRETATVARDFPAGFTPRGHRLVAGVVDMTGLPRWGRAFWRLIGGRPGDQRDWAAVDAWARQTAAELTTVHSRRPAGAPRP
jgi:menaquinone-dependent protoporphyrinogen oxidase